MNKTTDPAQIVRRRKRMKMGRLKGVGSLCFGGIESLRVGVRHEYWFIESYTGKKTFSRRVAGRFDLRLFLTLRLIPHSP